MKEIIEMDIKKVLTEAGFKNDDDIHLMIEGCGMDYSFEMDSKDYINFAKNDLKQGDSRGLVNSITNARRAIDCCSQKIIKIYGLQAKNNLPSRLELLEQIGVIAPAILQRVNKDRNLAEHEFILPNKKDVLEAIDIAELFDCVVRGVLNNAATEFIISISENDSSIGSLEFEFDEDGKRWTVKLHKENEVLMATIKNDGVVYKSILKIAITLATDESKAIDSFKELLKINENDG